MITYGDPTDPSTTTLAQIRRLFEGLRSEYGMATRMNYSCSRAGAWSELEVQYEKGTEVCYLRQDRHFHKGWLVKSLNVHFGIIGGGSEDAVSRIGKRILNRAIELELPAGWSGDPDECLLVGTTSHKPTIFKESSPMIPCPVCLERYEGWPGWVCCGKGIHKAAESTCWERKTVHYGDFLGIFHLRGVVSYVDCRGVFEIVHQGVRAYRTLADLAYYPQEQKSASRLYEGLQLMDARPSS